MDNENGDPRTLEQFVDENLDEIIDVIKDNYPDIDIFTRMRYTSADRVKEIVEQTKKENPGVKLFYVDIPYYGVVVYRCQTLKDTKEAATEGQNCSEKLIKEQGGYAAINNLEEIDRRRITKLINDKTNDAMSIVVLKKCVLYPADFQTALEKEELPAGVAPVMVDVISESSGFQNVRIEEI